MTCFAITLLLVSFAMAHAGEPAGFRVKIDAYESAVRANTLRIIEAKSEEERAALRAHIPDSRPCAAEVLALIQSNPNAPDIADGLNWLLTQCIHLPEGSAALELIAKKYPALPGIAPGIKRLDDIDPAIATPVLEAVLHSSAQPDEKAAAHYALAGHHFRVFETAAETSARDSAKEKATQHLQQIITDYPSVKIQGFPIADQSATLLFEMTHLSVGAIAPEITGKDDKDQPFKLSDFKGRAVLLIFWGDWCHGCHGLPPILSTLSTQFKDQPLSFLGVNTDEPVAARKALATSTAPWRCWIDGSTSGPITSEWNLRQFPTLYVLDKEGRILAKNPALNDLQSWLEKALATPAS